MKDGFGRNKLEKYFSILIQVPFRDLESEKLFSYLDVLRLGTTSWETKTILSKHFSGVFLLELSTTFGMLGKILFHYLSSKTLAFLLLLWLLLHAFLISCLSWLGTQSSSDPRIVFPFLSSPMSWLSGHPLTAALHLSIPLLLCWAWEVNKLLIDALAYHPNSPFLPHLPSSIYN